MFQLIVAVISIALVAALAIASIFYGGDAFTQSSERAVVTTLINQGQQVSGAVVLYKTDTGLGAPTGDVDETHLLVTEGYLAQAPNGGRVTDGDWTVGATAATIPFIAGADLESFCTEVAKQGSGWCAVDATSGPIAVADEAAPVEYLTATVFAFPL